MKLHITTGPNSARVLTGISRFVLQGGFLHCFILRNGLEVFLEKIEVGAHPRLRVDDEHVESIRVSSLSALFRRRGVRSSGFSPSQPRGLKPELQTAAHVLAMLLLLGGSALAAPMPAAFSPPAPPPGDWLPSLLLLACGLIGLVCAFILVRAPRRAVKSEKGKVKSGIRHSSFAIRHSAPRGGVLFNVLLTLGAACFLALFSGAFVRWTTAELADFGLKVAGLAAITLLSFWLGCDHGRARERAAQRGRRLILPDHKI